MKKENHSPFFDLNSKLQKRLDEIEEINYDICQSAQGFAALNSSILSFINQIKQIVNDKKITFFPADSFISEKNKEMDSHTNYQLFFQGDNIISSYKKLSFDFSNFISTFALETLCDKFTTTNVNEIRNKFLEILELKKDFNYGMKLKNPIQKPPFQSLQSILIDFHKVKSKLEASDFLQKIDDSSSVNSENMESLNKFLLSLEPIRDRLLQKISTLNSIHEDSLIKIKYPSPEILGNHSEFHKYVKIHSNLKAAFDSRIDTLHPLYVKIQRKQKQINLIVTDLINISSKMYDTLKYLEDETNRYTNIKCYFSKITVIDSSRKSYQFFEPEHYTNIIMKFKDESRSFFKEVDNCMKYSKSQQNSRSSLTSSSTSSSVLINDNSENRTSISHQQQILGIFTNFHKSIDDYIAIFEDKERDIYGQLREKLEKKKRLEANFHTKYPREDSSPKQELVYERKRSSEVIKSVNCAFECVNTDIEHTIADMKKIEEATAAFTAFHNFFKTEGTKFDESCMKKAALVWMDQVKNQLEAQIALKKNYIEHLRKNHGCVCIHKKSLCVTSCGHTFCESCLDLKQINEKQCGICPTCLKQFTLNDVIHINW